MKRLLLILVLAAPAFAQNNTIVASDDFNRAGPGLGANWTALFGLSTEQISAPGNVQVTSLSTQQGQVWTGWTGDDQCSWVVTGSTYNSGTGSAYFPVRPVVRATTASENNYIWNISSTTSNLYRDNGGSFTLIGNTGSIPSMPAGTVITLCAVGNVLSAYVNFARVLSVTDADASALTTGKPGFIGYSTANVNETAVAAWYGTSAEQRDVGGIWTKKSPPLPNIAADGLQGSANPGPILYENVNCIIGNPCYKMWFSNGNNTSYAESDTGAPGTWTRQASNIETNCWSPATIKNGSTYHHYCENTSTTLVQHYTSTDGVTWSAASFSSSGSCGTPSYAFFPFANVSGTWYAVGYVPTTVSGNARNDTSLWSSSDLSSWACVGSAPIITNFAGGFPVQVGGTWYMWGAAGLLGIGCSAPHAYGSPTQSYRMQSTNLTTWTNPVPSIHTTQLWESVNTYDGQALYEIPFTDSNGKLNLIGTSSARECTAGQGYQLTQAVAPVSLSQVVTQAEDGTDQVASDPLANLSNFTAPTGSDACQIVAGPYAEPTNTASYCREVQTAGTFSNDQYSEITIHADAASSFANPTVRAATGAKTAYFAMVPGAINSGNKCSIWKEVAGVQTQLWAPMGSTNQASTCTPQVGDVFRLVVIGTGSPNHTQLYLLQNNMLIVWVEDFNDSIASGNPGFMLFGNSAVTDSQISGWAGGNAGIIPTYPNAAGGAHFPSIF